MTAGLDAEIRQGVLHVAVRVKPRASRPGVLGVKEGRLEVAVAVPPTDGRANAELVERLGRLLNVPRRDISIVSGARGRVKRVAIVGVTLEALVSRLGK